MIYYALPRVVFRKQRFTDLLSQMCVHWLRQNTEIWARPGPSSAPHEGSRRTEISIQIPSPSKHSLAATSTRFSGKSRNPLNVGTEIFELGAKIWLFCIQMAARKPVNRYEVWRGWKRETWETQHPNSDGRTAKTYFNIIIFAEKNFLSKSIQNKHAVQQIGWNNLQYVQFISTNIFSIYI